MLRFLLDSREMSEDKDTRRPRRKGWRRLDSALNTLISARQEGDKIKVGSNRYIVVAYFNQRVRHVTILMEYAKQPTTINYNYIGTWKL